MEPKEDSPVVAKLRSLLNKNTRIEITDGRLFEGQFMCIDPSKNIILSGAYESRPHRLATTAAAAATTKAAAFDTATTASVSSKGTEAPAEGSGAATVTAEVEAEAVELTVRKGSDDTASTSVSTTPIPPAKKLVREEEERRFVGLVMIPGHHILRAEMDCSHLRGADSRIAAPKYDLAYLRG